MRSRRGAGLGLLVALLACFMGASTAGAYFEVAEALANPLQLSFGQVIGGYCAPGGLLDPLPTLELRGLIPQTISTMDL